MSRQIERVEDYTNAFLVTTGLMLFMVFFTLAAMKGMIWVLLSAALIDTLIRLKAARIRAREICQDR